MLKRLSIKTKLVLTILIYCLLANLVVGLVGWWSIRSAVETAAIQQLSIVRKAKAQEVQDYFTNLDDQLWSLTQAGSVVEAAVRFKRAFRELQTKQIAEEWRTALKQYYTTQYLPKLSSALPGSADYALYQPTGQAAQYLQYNYIVQNPEGEDKRIAMQQAADGSTYSDVHARFHPYFSKVLKQYGFDDIKLVDIDTGDVIYSAAKYMDLGSNLLSGPYAHSGLGAAIESVANNPDPGSSRYVDFDFYRPANGRPAAFVLAPVFNGAHPVAMLVLQFSADHINQIMTSGQNWAQYGLGTSGETFLVGSDQLMRSNSRLLIEQPDQYGALAAAAGLPARVVSAIKRNQSTVLYQQLSTPPVLAALNGEENHQVAPDYRGVSVISAYQPLQAAGTRWALLAQIDESEAFQPFTAVQNRLLIVSVILEAFFAFSAAIVAYLSVKPIDRLVSKAQAVDAGDLNVDLQSGSQDEIGELAKSMAGIVAASRSYQSQVIERGQQIDRLLMNLLPALFVNPVRNNVPKLTEDGQQVTVLFANIEGMDVLGTEKNSDRMIDFLSDLSTDLDEVAERCDVEKFLTGAGDAGVRMMALCGFSVPHLDQAQRSADFALSVRKIAAQLGTRYGVELQTTIGMASGPLTLGVVNGRRLLIEMWGDTPDLASALQEDARKDTIVVSQQVYERLHEFYVFERHGNDGWLLVRPVTEQGEPS